jgi:hypothetical protein
MLKQVVFQHGDVERDFRQQHLQLAVLVLQLLQLPGFLDLKTAILGFPCVDAGIADAVLAVKLRKQ